MSAHNYYVLRGDRRRVQLDSIMDQIDSLIAEREHEREKCVTEAEFLAKFQALAESPSKLRECCESMISPEPWAVMTRDQPMTAADLIWLFGLEEVSRQAYSRVSSWTTSRGEVSAEERGKRVKAITQKLEELQRKEELEVLRLCGQGMKIVRRESADPAIILSVWEQAA